MSRELSATEWITPKGKTVILSYVFIWEPNDDDKYTLAILIPKNEKSMMRELKACVDAAKELGVKKKWGGTMPPASRLKLPIKDGDIRYEEDPEKHEAYAGHYYINCSSNTKPGVVDKKGKEIKDPAELYSGCLARVSLNFGPYKAENGKSVGVAAFLNNVQKIDDGTRIGGIGKRSAAVDFGDGDSAEEDFDDEEYTPPAKKKKQYVEEEDEEYTPPKKKRRPVVEEDDDDDYTPPPKKKRRPADDDDDI